MSVPEGERGRGPVLSISNLAQLCTAGGHDAKQLAREQTFPWSREEHAVPEFSPPRRGLDRKALGQAVSVKGAHGVALARTAFDDPFPASPREEPLEVSGAVLVDMEFFVLRRLRWHWLLEPQCLGQPQAQHKGLALVIVGVHAGIDEHQAAGLEHAF